MREDPVNLTDDVRSRAAALIREHESALAAQTASVLAGSGSLDGQSWRECADALVRLLATAVEHDGMDAQGAALRDFRRYCPPLTTADLVDALQHAERIVLDALAVDDRLGAASDPWPVVAHTVRRATLQILGAYADQLGAREVNTVVRDSLTTLIAPPVFELAVLQEAQRAIRHEHALTVILFDVDDLAAFNRGHGWGAGDRLLERLGISARRYFRTHDWIARYGDDGIAVLLPETTLDQAASIASGFCEMVQQRLVLVDHKTDTATPVSVSAAVVGADRVDVHIDASRILAEAAAAVTRAKMNGGNRIERVPLPPSRER
ncbi:MAG: hypothetical protein DMF86_04810 [Acidobacteria bacterium]|nr:MAG: hypothetical protein DMF86_04810 [Acidobacteriota bacterium]